MPNENNVITLLQSLLAQGPIKIILSQPISKQQIHQKMIFHKMNDFYQVEKFSKTQVFHENLLQDEAFAYVSTFFPLEYSQLNSWTAHEQLQIKISKKGKPLIHRSPNTKPLEAKTIHNRQKNYILQEGTPIAPLVDMAYLPPKERLLLPCIINLGRLTAF